METLAAIGAGVGLAAACGFRVFLPLLVAALAAHAGVIHPGGELAVLNSGAVLLLLGVASFVEVLAYYIPWVDHLLDSIATPAAVIAGIVVAAAAFGDLPPAVRWCAALIAGGGTAAVVQTGTVATRAISTSTTGGLGNFLVATLEAIGAFFLSVLAVLVPVVALIVALVLVTLTALAIRKAWRLRGWRPWRRSGSREATAAA